MFETQKKVGVRAAALGAAVGFGLMTVSVVAPMAQAQTPPSTLPGIDLSKLSQDQREQLDGAIAQITEQLRGQLGDTVSNVRVVPGADGQPVVSWDVDAQKLMHTLGIDPKNPATANTMMVSNLPAGIDPSTVQLTVNGTAKSVTTLENLAQGAQLNPGDAVLGQLPTPEQLQDSKVQAAAADALGKLGQSGVWPGLTELMNKSGSSENFVNSVNTALGLTGMNKVATPNGFNDIGRSIFTPLTGDSNTVSFTGRTTPNAVNLDNPQSVQDFGKQVQQGSTPFAFTVGDITLFDGRIDPSLAKLIPAGIGDTTLRGAATDAINNINNVLAGLGVNRVGNGAPAPTPKPGAQPQTPAQPQQSVPALTQGQPNAQPGAQGNQIQNNTAQVSPDQARAALETLNNYVKQTEANKPAQNAQLTPQGQQNQSQAQSVNNQGGVQAQSQPAVNTKPAPQEQQTQAQQNVDKPAEQLEQDAQGNTPRQSFETSSQPQSNGSSSNSSQGSLDNNKNNNQGNNTRDNNNEVPPPTVNNHNKAAQGQMPTTGVSDSTGWLLGASALIIMAGAGIAYWSRRQKLES